MRVWRFAGGVCREARVMDTIAGHLSSVADRIQVPRSVPGLVTRRLLVRAEAKLAAHATWDMTLAWAVRAQP